MRLLVASNNAHKHQELHEIFDAISAPVDLITPASLGIDIEPDEIADTYAGNALLKARAFAHALQASGHAAPDIYVIADDSGLEVDALNAAPGIYSSRYHRKAPGGDGCAALLQEMQAVPDDRRSARFRCAIALVGPDGSENLFHGTCEGRIGYTKRGSGGFGFDPVFILTGDPYGRSMAELPSQEKHRVSHRGVAARKVAEFIAGARG